MEMFLKSNNFHIFFYFHILINGSFKINFYLIYFYTRISINMYDIMPVWPEIV